MERMIIVSPGGLLRGQLLKLALALASEVGDLICSCCRPLLVVMSKPSIDVGESTYVCIDCCC